MLGPLLLCQQLPGWHFKWEQGGRFEKKRNTLGVIPLEEVTLMMSAALPKAPQERSVPSKRTLIDTSP
jgi:hypothetical protein